LTVVALHTGWLGATTVVEDAKLARTTGFGGVELSVGKVLREVCGGLTPDAIAEALGPVSVTMFDALLGIERRDAAHRAELRESCEQASRIAAAVGCPRVQVVALDGFSSPDWRTIRRVMVEALYELSSVSAPHGVMLALEPVVFSPLSSLELAHEVVLAVGLDRVRIVLDTWHLWTAGVPWSKVAELDPAVIACAHIGDGRPRAARSWSDADRNVLPGDGIVPLNDGIAAIRSTGFEGPWAVEILGRIDGDPAGIAAELKRRALWLLDLSSRSVRHFPTT
jgi:sugar phosphate isomerase/epimerase